MHLTGTCVIMTSPMEHAAQMNEVLQLEAVRAILNSYAQSSCQGNLARLCTVMQSHGPVRPACKARWPRNGRGQQLCFDCGRWALQPGPGSFMLHPNTEVSTVGSTLSLSAPIWHGSPVEEQVRDSSGGADGKVFNEEMCSKHCD